MDVDLLLFVTLVLFSFAYVVYAICRVIGFHFRTNSTDFSGNCSPVTVLKPVCGLEFGLADNLRSFCRQDYGPYQIVFGVRDAGDPAIPIINRLKDEFPDVDITLVVDDRTIGSNLKVSNLANMFQAARHDIIVISDSDMRVGPDYLKAVVASFARKDVGAATCLYRGRPGKGIVSRLGAMFINDWFFPSALIPAMHGKLSYCFGATMAIRRDVLSAIGSFEALADILADDYMLGSLVVKRGLTIALVPYLVETVVSERSLKSLFLRELRWARTMRSVEPVGYTLSFITDLLPLSLLLAVPIYIETASAPLALGMILCASILRVALHFSVYATSPGRAIFSPWLIPARDLLSVAVRVMSFFVDTVRWRDDVFMVLPGNRLEVGK